MARFFYHDEELHRAIRRVWRSGRHVGADRPVARAYYRTVKLRRKYRRNPSSNVFNVVPRLTGNKKGYRDVYQGRWEPATRWEPLPNVRQFRTEQDYDSNGVASMTLDIDNVFNQPTDKGHGEYHEIVRGNFAPLRGYRAPKVAQAAGKRNEFFDVLRDKSTQIVVVAGYGENVVPVFSGLINDVDTTSRPDIITIQLRDGGQTLTDQRVFKAAKHLNIPDPIRFADYRSAFNERDVGMGADASSWEPGRHPRNVLTDEEGTVWVSGPRNSRNAREHVQIRLPSGLYHRIKVHPRFRGMAMYVSIYARGRNAPGGHGARKQHAPGVNYNNEWIDEGRGTVPGTNIPFIRRWNEVKAKPMEIRLPDHGYVLGDDSVLRITFTKLPRSGAGRNRAHRAGCFELKGYKAKLQPEAHMQKWLLVDDVADVVRTVLQWAGLNDWEVETTGVRLKGPVVFNRGNYLIDIINQAAEQVGYVFYMKPPASFDESPSALASKQPDYSMGTAVFRQQSSMKQGGAVIDPTEMVRDDQVLTGANVHFTDEPLPSIIMVRGAEKKKKEGGQILGADRTRRIMYRYWPFWARGKHGKGGNWPKTGREQHRNANIKKHVVHHDEKLKSFQEVKIAALMIALNSAAAAAQAQVQLPAMPTIYLDHHVSLFDRASGLSSRLWVATRSLEFLGGPNGHFNMALAGSLLDTPDFQVTRQELQQALRDAGYHPGQAQWEIDFWWSRKEAGQFGRP